MISRFYILIVLVVCLVFSAFPQSTNTRKWRKTENDSMQNALFLFDAAKYTAALPIYENLYNSHPKEEYLKYCYGKCALYRSDKHETAHQLLSEIYEKNKKVADIEFDLAKAKHYNYKFDEALVLLDKFLNRKRIDPTLKKEALQLKQYCINAKLLYGAPTEASITNAGNILNTEYNEYVPVISADESMMIYTYSGIQSMGGLQNEYMQEDKYGKYYEDIFLSYKENGAWAKPTPIKSINTLSHDAAIAVNIDGSKLFTYKDVDDGHGDIYMSNFVNGEWTIPEKLEGQVNSYSWEGSCSLTADGTQLYFSSERSGGFGGKDIYRATLLLDGTWGNVTNLGDSINTALDDDSPFIHPDGVTLFYSSKGKNSMGDYDIFQARLNWKDSTFSAPVNLGYPINTPDGDRFYVLSANSEAGYYASGKSDGHGLQDIYMVHPGYVGKKPSLQIVKGSVLSDEKPVEADITVEITSMNNKKFGAFKTNPLNGSYLISLPAGAEFVLTYTYKSFPNKTLSINTTNIEGYKEEVFNVRFNTRDTLKIAGVTTSKKDTIVVALKTTTLTPLAIAKPPVKKETAIVSKTVTETPVAITKSSVKKETVVKEEEFVPQNALQAKTKIYSEKYGSISAEGLEFKVQIAAYKFPKNYVYNHLKKLGKVEELLLNDGITRLTIGGSFKTLGEAFTHNKKVVIAGQKDAFVTVLFNGKRIFLEELEKTGIYKSTTN